MKKIIILVFVFIFALSMTACASQEDNSEANANLSVTEGDTASDATREEEIDIYDETTPIVQDGNVMYVSNQTERSETYDTLQDLNSQAGDVLIGKCISTETIFQNETIYTLSKIQVGKVYKGDIVENSIIQVIEHGGTTTEDVYATESGFHEKAFFDPDSVSADVTVVVGMDGYFPIEKDQEVMLFLEDITGFLKNVSGIQYGVVGAYDGKLIKDTDTSYTRPAPSNDSNISAYSMKHGTLTIDLSELDTLE